LHKAILSIFGLVKDQTIYWLLPCLADIEIVTVGPSQSQIRWPADLANFINRIGEEAEGVFRKVSSSHEEVTQLYNEFLISSHRSKVR